VSNPNPPAWTATALPSVTQAAYPAPINQVANATQVASIRALPHTGDDPLWLVLPALVLVGIGFGVRRVLTR
jgi:hypothetical protein